MTVFVPVGHPAITHLKREGVSIRDSIHIVSDQQPIRLAFINLMPNKIETEIQWLRLLGRMRHTVDVTLVGLETYRGTHTAAEHLDRFYVTFSVAKRQMYDGLIITGAPVETLPFSEVRYWNELTQILDWARNSVHSSLFVCFAAQAALHHYYQVPKRLLPGKLTGVFKHRVTGDEHPLTTGFGTTIVAPQSRYSTTDVAAVLKHSPLHVLAQSAKTGVYIAADSAGREVYMTGHPEYDRLTLQAEYIRDCERSQNAVMPAHYFPGNNPTEGPTNTWKDHAEHLMYNWLESIKSHKHQKLLV
jgi:homoserine O-succinyltransferase/O-acetyltransferase